MPSRVPRGATEFSVYRRRGCSTCRGRLSTLFGTSRFGSSADLSTSHAPAAANTAANRSHRLACFLCAMIVSRLKPRRTTAAFGGHVARAVIGIVGPQRHLQGGIARRIRGVERRRVEHLIVREDI